MSFKKLSRAMQLFIVTACSLCITALHTAEENPASVAPNNSDIAEQLDLLERDAAVVRGALQKSLREAMSRKKKELQQEIAGSLDAFAQIYRGYKELIIESGQRRQSLVALENSLITDEAYDNRIADLHNDLVAAHAETRQAIAERERLQAELNTVQQANNDLRYEIGLLDTAPRHRFPSQ